MAPTTKNAKPIFKTSSPFTETKWPVISHDDQDIIIDLVCNLIAPLGDHRRTHIHPSKGKKRKRKSKEGQDDSATTDTPPPPPEIGQHILIGINSITRHLEALAARNAPSTMPEAILKSEGKRAPDDMRPFSMIILTHPKPSISPAHAHFPTLVHLSTLQHPSPAQTSTISQTTRLVPLATSSDARLASTLHIPRVGALAIFSDAPGARALVDYVRQHVGLTECVWIDEAMKAEWKGVTVKSEVPGKEKVSSEDKE